MEWQKRTAWEDQWVVAVSIYHFLSRAFGQRVTVAQVIDLDITDVVSILSVDVGIERGRAGRRGFGTTRALGLGRDRVSASACERSEARMSSYRADWRDINVLDTLSGLYLGIYFCGRGSSSGCGILDIAGRGASGITSDGTATTSGFRIPVGG